MQGRRLGARSPEAPPPSANSDGGRSSPAAERLPDGAVTRLSERGVAALTRPQTEGLTVPDLRWLLTDRPGWPLRRPDQRILCPQIMPPQEYGLRGNFSCRYGSLPVKLKMFENVSLGSLLRALRATLRYGLTRGAGTQRALELHWVPLLKFIGVSQPWGIVF